MKMRVADYITDALYNAGGEHVFLITGGMIMHLTDALLQHKKQKYICCHHEQAAAMAAEAYGRYTNNLGVVYVTAGPGSLNTITGVVGALVDTSPCIIVAGQSKVSQAIVTKPRQFALQGFNNLPLFKQITKYAVMLDDISRIKYEIEKCICIAKESRVGPVYIECPIDIQAAVFDPDEYEGFFPKVDSQNATGKQLEKQVDVVIEALQQSSRPCILAGAGVRLANAINLLHQFANTAQIPVLTSRLGMDLIGYDHPLFVGRPGTYGDRPANFTTQNCDLIISIGCRMGLGLVGHDFQEFAKSAKKIMVDVDENELTKPAVIPDIAIQADAAEFFRIALQKLNNYEPQTKRWVGQTQTWKDKYPVDLPEYATEKKVINSYHFTRLFSEKMSPDSVFVLDTGSCFHVFAQAFKVKFGQRHIITGGLSTMGYMPGVIGVAAASQGKEVYCITGDGSIQMNIQELQTIAYTKLPVKIIIFNNNGYLLIRHSQNNFQEGRLIGEGPSTGVGFPDMKEIASAYKIPYMRISSIDSIDSQLDDLVSHKGALICEVMTPSDQLLIPRVASKKLPDGKMMSMPYDDMFPFLPRDEYNENCVAAGWESNS